MTDPEWMAEQYRRMVVEAAQRMISVQKLVMGLAGMCGNLIACNLPDVEKRAELLGKIEPWAKDAMEHELARLIAMPPAGRA